MGFRQACSAKHSASDYYRRQHRRSCRRSQRYSEELLSAFGVVEEAAEGVVAVVHFRTKGVSCKMKGESDSARCKSDDVVIASCR